MIIRKAKKDDIDILAEFWAKMVKEAKVPLTETGRVEMARFKAAMLDEIGDSDSFIIILEAKENIAGYVYSYVFQKHYGMSELIGKVEHIYIRPEYRGRGWVKRMLAWSELWLRARGVRYIMAEIGSGGRLAKIWDRVWGAKTLSHVVYREV